MLFFVHAPCLKEAFSPEGHKSERTLRSSACPRSLSDPAHKTPAVGEAGPGSLGFQPWFTGKYSNSLKGLLQQSTVGRIHRNPSSSHLFQPQLAISSGGILDSEAPSLCCHVLESRAGEGWRGRWRPHRGQVYRPRQANIHHRILFSAVD